MTEICCEEPATSAELWLQGLAGELALVVGGLDVGGLTGAEAAGLTDVFARLERLAVAGKTLAAGRVADTGYCREMGFDTAAHWLADRTKASAFEAAKTLDTARHLADESLGLTREALVAGTLTATQAHEIAGAAARAPGEQEGLFGE